jgi:hypothetical protein
MDVADHDASFLSIPQKFPWRTDYLEFQAKYMTHRIIFSLTESYPCELEKF